jgi:hypothetical protein
MVETALPVDEDRALVVVKKAMKAYESEQGLYGKLSHPERPFIDLVSTYGQDVTDPNYSLNSLFFFTTVVFGDNTSRLLARAANPEKFEPNSYMFMPEVTAFDYIDEDADEEKLLERKLEHDLVGDAQEWLKLSYNVKSIPLWPKNAHVLVDQYRNDLNNFFEENNFHAPTVLKNLVGPENKKKWKRFHRFGPKVGRLFMIWADQYALPGKKFSDMNQIGIPVDFQVARVMIQTGVLNLGKPTHQNIVLEKTLVPFFEYFCPKYGYEGWKVSAALWNVGHLGCNKERHDICPVNGQCFNLISRAPYDKSGLFDPRDKGRFGLKLAK